MNRRFFISSAAALAVSPSLLYASPAYNDYAAELADRFPGRARIVRSGQTWQSLYGKRANIARFYNRQNVALEARQVVVNPPTGRAWGDFLPQSARIRTDEAYHLVVDPGTYSFVLYESGQAVHFGAAVCGAAWCEDVGRRCQTPSGNFPVSEIAGPNRRSSKYPVIEAAEGKGALMPYYLRLTKSGVGVHARYIRGRHETHGCIGVFYDDAKWLNLNVATPHGLVVTVRPYG
jgi:L,D-transpeptidase ErfK/SrfK